MLRRVLEPRSPVVYRPSLIFYPLLCDPLVLEWRPSLSQQVQSEDPVLLEVVDGVGIITLNRPHVYNAMNQDLA